MKSNKVFYQIKLGGVGLLLLLLWSFNAEAQVYSSGSTGADGAFAPTSSMSLTVPSSGILNFTTVTIPTGVTVTFAPNTANTTVTILATGDVNIAGTISVNGSNGLALSSGGSMVNAGGIGGPGGFPGGSGGMRAANNTAPFDGEGPGGGTCCYIFQYYGTWYFGQGGSYGANPSFTSLIPLFGGSGGSGGYSSSSYTGASGAGGGGAILISSSTQIVISGSITANGGVGGKNTIWQIAGCGGGSCYYDYSNTGGSGSGGAIRLVAPTISGTGSLQAVGGGPSGYTLYGSDANTSGKPGMIRLEAFSQSFTGSSSPVPYTSLTPGPSGTGSNPALANLPALTFASIGAVPAPSVPGGSYSSADVNLPQGTTNPVPVTLAASNIPVGTVFTVRLIPQFASSTSYSTSASTGTFSSSTASVPVTFPSGQISVLNAYASFTLPVQVAALYPLIDGEPVDRVMVAANYGQASEVTFFTKSGKEMKADRLFKDLR